MPSVTVKDSFAMLKSNYWDVILWVGYNVGLGLMTFWMAWLLHYMAASIPGPMEKVYKGEVMIFVTTLCASSMAVFAEIRDPHFRNTKRLVLFVVTVIVIGSSATGAIVAIPPFDGKSAVDAHRVFLLSVFMFTLGVIASLVLYVMRLTIDKYDFRREQVEEIAEVTDEAKGLTKTKDGARL
ncbi:MAG TPA: hypothetical protein VE863_18445 [Pyrinomonadaceae bacterium]|jgi:hypothetical protein|nr:hypothetical protein [Pyrinomonadaceae bacterium]